MKENKKVILICTVCSARNYRVDKSNSNELLAVMKYCKNCNKHTLHKETR